MNFKVKITTGFIDQIFYFKINNYNLFNLLYFPTVSSPFLNQNAQKIILKKLNFYENFFLEKNLKLL